MPKVSQEGTFHHVSRLSTRGVFFAKTVVKNEPFWFQVIVVRNRVGSNLLSRNAAEKMSLVKLLDKVYEKRIRQNRTFKN